MESCPGTESFCDLTEHTTSPCASDAQYRCPYYMGAEDGLYGHLPDITDPRDTQYFEALANTTKTDCPVDASDLGDAAASIVNTVLSAAGSVTNTCGQLYQARPPRPPEPASYETLPRALRAAPGRRCGHQRGAPRL